MIERQTARLRLRQWQESDFERFAQYYAEEETARYVGGVVNRDQAWRRMATQIGHWSLRGYGYWAVEEKATGRFVGGVGLWRSAEWPELELGYWLVPEMHGKGYATEAGLEARDFAFSVMGATSLLSYIDPANEPSKKVAERLGARFESTIELLSHGPHDVYRYTPPEAPVDASTSTKIDGSCHCGNLSFEIVTPMPLHEIRARACDCRFCRIHGAKNWSDPRGKAEVRVIDRSRLRLYRFALATADFYLCTGCGAYMGAVLSEEDLSWSTLNLRLTALAAVPEVVASYGDESSEERVGRRKRAWTPTQVVLGS